MLGRPRHIGSPLQAYVARLFQRDQAREKQAKENGLGGGGAELLPGLEVLERRMLLSASYGPMPDQEVVTSDSADRPAVNVVSAPDNTIEVSNIKWRGQQVDAAQYEWIIRYSVDSQLSDAALTALAKDLSPFAEIENLNAPGFGVLTAPFPNLKGWQLNRWANTQGQIAYLEPNFTGSAATAPNDPAYDEGLWGLRNQGDSNGQKSLEYNTGSQTFVEVTDTGDPNYNPDFTEGIDINVEDAWSSTTGSLSVVVPVVDSGIDYTHPDLYLNIWVNQDEIPAAIKNNLTDVNSDGLFTFLDINDASNSSAILVSDTNGNGYIDAGDLLADSDWANGVDDSGDGFADNLHGWDFVNYDNNPMDDHFHGTHVSGTIGALGNNGLGVSGVNWNVQLMPLKVLTSSNLLATGDAINALEYMNMTKRDFDVNIVAANHSWGGAGPSSALLEAFNAGGEQDILHVVAAGNQGSDINSSPHHPASFDSEHIIAVANLDSEGNLNSGSNYSDILVDLGAPGTNILSTMPVVSTSAMTDRDHPKTSSYDFATGTSMAAPHVTGVAALLAAYNPQASASDIRDAILGSTAATSSLAGLTVTGGRLDAEAARQALGVAGPHVESIPIGEQSPRVDEITINFTQDILTASVIQSNFLLTSDGADNIFGTGDDVSITTTGLDQPTSLKSQVTMEFASDLAADTYRLTLVGAGGTPIRNATGQALDDGDNHIFDFVLYESDFAETNDVKDDATDTMISGTGTFTASGFIGDATFFDGQGNPKSDVDLFEVVVNAGGVIEVGIDTPANATLDSYLRVFDSSGNVLAFNNDWDHFDSAVKVSVVSAGTYYIGVSGNPNTDYLLDSMINPSPLSGFSPVRQTGFTGAYDISIDVEDAPSSPHITGSVWHDIDAEGDVDSGEGALYGWTVFIDADKDGTLDGGEVSTETDMNGEYWLANPGNGTHWVTLITPSGWEQTYPSGGAVQSLSISDPGATFTDIDFGARISGSIVVNTGLNHSSQRLTQAGDVTLSNAVKLAKLYAGHDVINFDASLDSAVFSSLNSPIQVDSDLDIVGLSSGVIDIGNAVRITSGTTAKLANISISGVDATSAIYNLGTTTVDSVSIHGNTGGVPGTVANYSVLTIVDSVIYDNTTPGIVFGGVEFGGGGILQGAGSLTLESSTVSGNSSGLNGGGIDVLAGTVSIINSTITGNRADSDNSAVGEGGGIYVDSGTVTLHNSIVAENYVGSGGSEASDDVSGAFDTSSSYNLIGTVTGSTGLDDLDLGNQVGITGFLLDPGLADLADNGGPTMTHALVYGSNAIDAGSDSVASTAGLTEDQRGEERFAYGTAAGSGQVDVGAYEWQPTTIVVDENGAGTTANGTTSIREALLEAESAPALSVIEFGSGFTSQNILMGSVSELDINSDVKILGETASWGSVTFDGQQGSGGTTRIFDVASDVEVSISHVTIKNGTATNGGGIQNAGTLFLDSVTVQDNVAGAGIGGGIYSLEDAVLTISDSMLSGNEGLFGGAIGNYGELDVIRSNVILNEAYHGGGIANANTGSLSILNSAVALNEADGGGGGVQSAGSTVILNSTVSGNTADADGGGVWQNQGTLTVVNGTIAENRANANDSPGTGNEGGGIYKASGATATLYNTIVATNERGTSSPTDDDLGGTFSSSSLNNLINVFSSGGGITDSTNGNMVGGSYDPLLGSLTFNGGATLNHALGTGSDAIDLGNNAAASLFLGLWDWDQRGDPYDRIDNGTVDIGAYEVQV